MANETTKIVTGKVRLSYANIWELKSVNGGEPAYSCRILISKNDKETLAKIHAATKEAEKAGMEKFGAKFTSGHFLRPLMDGDAKYPDDEIYANHYYINTKNKKYRPGIVDKNREPITDSTEVYSGCYARVSVDFFPYNHTMNKGVSCSLEGIQKIADGEPLGGSRRRAEDMFDVYEDDDDDFLS